MNIEEIAERLTEEDRQKVMKSSIWSHLQIEESSNSASTNWPACLRSESHLKTAWSNLPKTAAQTLAAIINKFGAVPFREEQLLEIVPAGSIGGDYRLGLLRLLQSGIVFAVRKGWGEKLYFIPKDTFMLWYRIINSDFICSPIDNLNIAQIIPIEQDEGYKSMLGFQLLYTMAEIKRTDMRLTSKGVLTKRTIDRCLKQLKIAAAGNKILGISEEVVTVYPFPLAFALEIIFSHGWLIQQNGSLEIQHAWHNWLTKPTMQRETELLQWIVNEFIFRHVSAGQAAALLSRLVPMKWYRVADVDTSLHTIIAESGRAEAAIAASHLYYDWLSSLGWLETAQTTQGDKMIRWLIPSSITPGVDFVTSDPVSISSEPIRITPDGEIFVYPNCSNPVRWLLETIAERRRTDMVTVYKVDAHSLSQAQKGFSGVRIVELLEEASEERLPDMVRLTIMDAMKAEEDVPLPIAEAKFKSARVSTEKCGKQTLLSESDSLHEFDLLTDWPSYKSLFAGLDDIPVMWVKQFRSYHFTTRRELLERALSWRISVKLNYQGTDRLFVPERIEEAETEWAVVGCLQEGNETTPVRLAPGMWGEMMLIIPPDAISR